MMEQYPTMIHTTVHQNLKFIEIGAQALSGCDQMCMLQLSNENIV